MSSIRIYIRLKRLSFTCFSAEAKQQQKQKNIIIISFSFFPHRLFVWECLCFFFFFMVWLTVFFWKGLDKEKQNENKSRYSIAIISISIIKYIVCRQIMALIHIEISFKRNPLCDYWKQWNQPDTIVRMSIASSFHFSMMVIYDNDFVSVYLPSLIPNLFVNSFKAAWCHHGCFFLERERMYSMVLLWEQMSNQLALLPITHNSFIYRLVFFPFSNLKNESICERCSTIGIRTLKFHRCHVHLI